jgi:hypothetical protein
MISENCKINTAHIFRLNKKIIDPKIVLSLTNNFIHGNEKCEFSFSVYEGYPEELQKVIEKCQNYLLSDSLKVQSKLKNEQKTESKNELQIKLHTVNKNVTKLASTQTMKQSQLKVKEIDNAQLLEEESKFNTTKNNVSKMKVNGGTNIDSSIVDSQQNKTSIAKKCYDLRFSSAYKDCLNMHYKCHLVANDREKLKDCRLKNGINGFDVKKDVDKKSY